jgi:hypothetical protein
MGTTSQPRPCSTPTSILKLLIFYCCAHGFNLSHAGSKCAKMRSNPSIFTDALMTVIRPNFLLARWIETTPATIKRSEAQLTYTHLPSSMVLHNPAPSPRVGHIANAVTHTHLSVATLTLTADTAPQPTRILHTPLTLIHSQCTTTHYYSQYSTETHTISNRIQYTATTHLHQPAPTRSRLLFSLILNHHQHSNAATTIASSPLISSPIS